MSRLFKFRLFRLFGSFGMAIVLLVLLLVVVYLGTIEQTRIGLYDVQKKYFESFYFFADLPGSFSFPFQAGPASIPLPGVYLILLLFSINLFIGNILRVPFRRDKIGLHITHWGILLLLLGGLVTHHFADDGQMTLAPGGSSSRFQSYHLWEIAVTNRSNPDFDLEYVIPENHMHDLEGDKRRTFEHSSIPFGLSVSGYSRNAHVMPKGPMFEAPTPVIDGYFVNPQPLRKENEANWPAVYVHVQPPGSSEEQSAILWGGYGSPLEWNAEIPPWSIRVGDPLWDLRLRKKSMDVPFEIQLQKFTHQYHPGTEVASNYQSEITMTEGGRKQDILIKMNEPLRHRGYTFFQASFLETRPGSGVFASTFAVVRNPTDHWPLYACIVVTTGMLIHLGGKLWMFLSRQRGGRNAAC
jgi:hypothetical protein